MLRENELCSQVAMPTQRLESLLLQNDSASHFSVRRGREVADVQALLVGGESVLLPTQTGSLPTWSTIQQP